ncbi:MAG: ACP S-malonyltransferase [Pseudomonadota bacterium]
MSKQSLAFVFPGQGSQKPGMLLDAQQRFAAVAATIEEASDALGYDVWSLVQNGSQEDLNLTETTQPVLLTASVALWRAWQEESGAVPGIMAGHSLGEFTALVCAGSLAFSDAVLLVRRRGQFMQSAVPVGEGAMAAILGLEDDRVRSDCDAAAEVTGQVVAPVNFNAPGQVVIAGHTEAVEAAIAQLKASGAKRAMPLPVSAPFHTELMKPAGERLAEAIADVDIAEPRSPVVHNVHARTESEPERIRELLVEQIYSPVLWTACVGNVAESGATRLVECGPGKVLSGLNRRINSSLDSYPLEAPDDLLTAVTELG